MQAHKSSAIITLNVPTFASVKIRASAEVVDNPQVPLVEFPFNSKEHVLRVKVVRKFDPVQNLGQVLGHKARLTPFGNNIDLYSSIFHDNGIFDVKT
ncbi:hypothetical protein V2J09_000701 [Rumex salicifolius]